MNTPSSRDLFDQGSDSQFGGRQVDIETLIAESEQTERAAAETKIAMARELDKAGETLLASVYRNAARIHTRNADRADAAAIWAQVPA